MYKCVETTITQVHHCLIVKMKIKNCKNNGLDIKMHLKENEKIFTAETKLINWM